MRLFVWIAASIVCGGAAAQMDYPRKPIRFVVPFQAGGGSDILTRMIAGKLSERLGWTTVVINTPGAGCTIGVNSVTKAPADGHTILAVQTNNLITSATLFPSLPYDPLRDLTPVILLSEAPQVIVTPAQSAYRTLGELVAAAQAKPGEIMFAFPGNGTDAMLTVKYLQAMTKTSFLNIPYQSSAQAITDLFSGSIDALALAVPSIFDHIKRGRVRALAVTSKTRIALLPDVPTVAEMGYEAFDVQTRIGILLPAEAPATIVKRINAEINRVLSQPEVRERIHADGGSVLGGSPEDFSASLWAGHEKWKAIIKNQDIRVE